MFVRHNDIKFAAGYYCIQVFFYFKRKICVSFTKLFKNKNTYK